MQTFDLIICGGGLAGASLAVALAPSGLRIALVETTPASTSGAKGEADARAYAITPANAAWLTRIGIWKHLSTERLSPIEHMNVFGDNGTQLVFSAHQARVDTLGWMVEAAAITAEFSENLKRQANLTLFCPAHPSSVDFGNEVATLTLNDGQTLAAPLIVAADGRDSWLRRAAGLEAFETPYHETGIVANFACAKDHQQTAWQWFADDSVLAYLPLAEQHISIVWALPDSRARTLLDLDPTEFARQVAEAGHHVLGELKPTSRRVGFALRHVRVPQTIAPRLALVGDAAHAIHPLSGHGINLGLQDSCALADLLTGLHEQQDPGSVQVLRRYQRARREETVLFQQVTHGLHELFKARLPGIRPLRNIGLLAFDRAGPIKTLMTRYAIGVLS